MRTLLLGGSIYTGIEDRLIEGSAILIEDNKIAAVDQARLLAQSCPDAVRIDLAGRTILPGLTDAHRHLVSRSAWEVTPDLIGDGMIDGVLAAYQTLEEGITNVRDPGCRHYGVFTLREAIRDQRIPGPHVYAAGPNPTGEAAPKSWRNIYIHDPWSMRQAVRQLKRDGADWIKIIVTGRSAESGWRFTQKYLTDAEICAAADEAHALGLPVSGHIEAPEGTQAALEAGFDLIDHGTGIRPDQAQTMAGRGLIYVPTLSFLHYNDIETVWGNLDPELSAAMEAYQGEHARSFRSALEAGVKIAVGTDYADPLPSPDHGLVEEMELMVSGGMTTAQVLHAATVTGADATGRSGCAGKIQPGFEADLIAVRGNPLEDLKALKKVDLVLKSGKIEVSKLERPALPVHEDFAAKTSHRWEPE